MAVARLASWLLLRDTIFISTLKLAYIAFDVTISPSHMFSALLLLPPAIK